LYVSSEKLSRVMEVLDSRGAGSLEPVPVKELNGEIVSTDGHTRALALYMKGFSEVEVEWEDTDLDWEAYEIAPGISVSLVGQVQDNAGGAGSQEGAPLREAFVTE